MGIIKKLLEPLVGDQAAAINQAKALIKADKISRGEKVPAPKHPTDEKHFREALADPSLKEKVDKIDKDLIANVNRMTIRSFDPPERPKSNRPLPSRESEEEHKHDQKYEYGFYEPPVEKLEKGRLMFREAMELLQARMELELKGERMKDARGTLEKHPALKRITPEDVDHLYEFYRPFVVRDKERVVVKEDLDMISDYMNNRTDMIEGMGEITAEFKALFRGQTASLPTGSPAESMGPEERSQFLEEYERRRVQEARRLEQSLKRAEIVEEVELTEKKAEDPKSTESKGGG
ncbi:hypothetical protein M3Y99_00753900 [Aphelenchoides fujianensis]|nr:hypothetical protein M3Y99_00753900 [Aphelenchoides fujianensis]